MQSFISAGWIAEMLKRSGNLSGPWMLLCLNDRWQPQSGYHYTLDQVPQEARIGMAEVPVKFDEQACQVLAAAPSVSIANIGNMAPGITSVAMFTSMERTLAAYYGPDLIKMGFRVQDADGNLVITFNETNPMVLEL